MTTMLEDKYVTIDGASIHYIESGNGMPVILCHGARFNARTYEESGTIEAIQSAGFHAYSIDFPGYGKSENLSVDLPSFIAKFIDILALQPGAVMGASMGGEAVAAFGTKYPDKYKALILVGAVGIAPMEGNIDSINDKPVLLIWGKNDAVSAPENYEILEKHIKNYTFYNVGRQHACYLDDAVEFNERIVDFLKKLD